MSLFDYVGGEQFQKNLPNVIERLEEVEELKDVKKREFLFLNSGRNSGSDSVINSLLTYFTYFFPPAPLNFFPTGINLKFASPFGFTGRGIFRGLTFSVFDF